MRRSIIVIAVILVLVIVAAYCQAWWGAAFFGMALDGAFAAAWLASGILLGQVVTRRLKVGRLLSFCSAAGLGLGFFSLMVLWLGLMGWLNRWSGGGLLLLAAIVGVVDRFVLGPSDAPSVANEQVHPGWDWAWLALVPFAAIALTATNVMPAVLWKPIDPHPYDVMSYHLQVPREWYEMGRIVPLKHNVYSFFPFNVEMNYLLAMHLRGGPWAGMYLAQMMSFIFMSLAVASVAAAMPGIRAGIIAAVAMAAIPWTTMLGGIAYNESGLLLYVALAAAWAIRASRLPVQIVRDLAIGGAMAGLACGVKYTAVPLVLIGFPLAAMVAFLLLRREDLKRVMLGGIVWIGVGALLFAPWLVRNAAWVGNPVFPLAMRQLGSAHFTAEQVERFERAHRAADAQSSPTGRIWAFWREVVADWRFGWLLIPLGTLAAALNLRRPEVLFLVLCAIGIAIFWVGFTHLMGRFAVPAVPILAMFVGFFAIDERWILVGAGVVLLMAVGTFIRLNLVLLDSLEQSQAWSGLIRLDDLNELWPEALLDIEKKNTPLALIGDAQAFYRPLPRARLEYRTIFDVVVPPGKNIVDAWLGRDLEELRKDHYILLNPGELNRLSRTYYGIPSVPPQWQRRDDETIILAPLKN